MIWNGSQGDRGWSSNPISELKFIGWFLIGMACPGYTQSEKTQMKTFSIRVTMTTNRTVSQQVDHHIERDAVSISGVSLSPNIL
jgi:hypothetical protein